MLGLIIKSSINQEKDRQWGEFVAYDGKELSAMV